MSDDEMRRVYQSRRSARDSRGERAAVPHERLVALVEGRGAESERLATLDAVMSDPESAREFELLHALHANVRTARSIRPRRVAIISSLAAAALLIVAGLPALRSARTPAMTSRMRAVDQGAALIRPALEASPAASRTFEWRPVSGARSYVLEILTADGTLVFSRRTTQTSVTLPPDAQLPIGVEYRWWVTSELTDGTQRRSPFRRLLVTNSK